jgi:hypothetical protein
VHLFQDNPREVALGSPLSGIVTMSLSLPSARTSVALLFGCLLIGGIPGCGADQYETRLKQSKDYYNYLDRIEQNLAPKWSDNRVVDMIRVPIQFQPIPAPVPVKNENGEETLPPDDRNLDFFSDLTFNSQELIGAWQAPFSAVAKDGSTVTAKGYILLLSNYWEFLNDSGEALKFIGAKVNQVGNALKDQIPQDKLEKPPKEPHPKRGRYLPEVWYDVYTFNPTVITLSDSESKPKQVNYTFTLYAQTNGNIQGIVLVVLPDNIPQQEKLVDRIPMMLEHFHITRSEPKPASQTGGAPAATTPAGF